MKKITAILTTAFLFITLNHTLQAADFSYNYAQVSYDDVDLDIGQGLPVIGGNGFSVSGAFEITPDFFISADYRTYDLDYGIDLNVWDIGVGYYQSINAKTDLVAGFAIGNLDLETVDLDTWTINAGVRHQLNDKLELGAQVNYVDYDGNASDTRIGANVLYAFKKDLSGIFALEFGDVDVMSLGVRFDF